MRLGKSSRLLILVAAFAAQLWLSSAHAFQHPALQAEPLCQLCLHAPSLDHGAAPPAGPALLLPAAPAPLASGMVRLAPAALRSHCPIRGPPHALR